MASVIEAIRDILRPGIFEERALVLREADPGSRCPAIALSKRGKALMIRPDQVPASGISPPDRLFPLFNIQKDGICQLCDYLVFYPQPHPSSGGSDLFVFLFELKSGSAKGSVRQLRNGKLLADYVLEVAHLHAKDVQRPRVHYRGVTFVGDAPRPRIVARYHKSFEWIDDDKLPALRICSCQPLPSHDLDNLCL
ncbi:MAG: hypothetical protein H0T76_01045 [Nannocystis sp.]|nr:hypothetical protein [Nannocystis sp.]MBA3545047.1 hypothetical protein [Nannocystis sp.]